MNAPKTYISPPEANQDQPIWRLACSKPYSCTEWNKGKKPRSAKAMKTPARYRLHERCLKLGAKQRTVHIMATSDTLSGISTRPTLVRS